MVSVAASMTLHCMFARSDYSKADEAKILVASWACLARAFAGKKVPAMFQWGCVPFNDKVSPDRH
jgi:hypothetical protein